MVGAGADRPAPANCRAYHQWTPQLQTRLIGPGGHRGQEGAAALQVHDDGDAELFIAFGELDDPVGAATAAYRAIDALSWGYCDRWAYVTDNCAPLTDEEVATRPVPLPTARPLPEDEHPRPLPRPSNRPG